VAKILGDALDTPGFIEALKSERTSPDIAREFNAHESTVRRRRVKMRDESGGNEAGTEERGTAGGEFFWENPDGTCNYSKFSDRVWTRADHENFMRASGINPDNFTFATGWTSKPGGGAWNKINNVRPIVESYETSGPEWPVIQPGPPVAVRTPRARTFSIGGKWQTAVLSADPQIGYRRLEDGTMDPFHSEPAIDIFLKIVEIERPQQMVLMGDIIDLPAQGRWAQEAGFAQTTQPAIDRTTMLGAEIRERTPGKIVYIEGNHDRRMQNFVETNALSAFGLKKGAMPDSWPVMSLQNLLRLDDFGIKYMDAYPTSHWWVNDQLKCEHGTKVNSSGSTAQKYMAETPHFSRAFGHTHRLEAQSHTTYDRVGKIKSVAINPGCLCRVDGGVPGVHSAIDAKGKPAEVFEDWQNGVAVIRFKESGEFFWELVQIEDGVTVYNNQEIRA
jgi:predicted phosphodiesterase